MTLCVGNKPLYYIDLLIDSSSRISGNSSNFKIQLPFSLKEIMKVELQSLSMLNSFYNITTSNNNIDVNDGTAIFTYSIPVGSYNTTNLMSTIASGLTTASSTHGALTFSASYSATTFLTTISATGNFSLLWSSGTNTLTNPHSILGFVNTDNSGTNTYTGSNVVNLFNPSNIYIISPEIGSYHSLTPISNDSFTFYINNNVNSGELINYTLGGSYSQFIEYINPLYLFTITFYLMTNNNTPISLNGSEWSMIVRFSSKCKIT
jgi:hypothetical protein